MRLLLDTHVLVWWLEDNPKLKSEICEVIANPENEIFISSVTIWEISIKKGKGQLDVTDDLAGILQKAGYQSLDITFAHGWAAGKLPLLHRDPFDRMLIAQAQIENLILVTEDAQILNYQVSTFPARKP